MRCVFCDTSGRERIEELGYVHNVTYQCHFKIGSSPTFQQEKCTIEAYIFQKVTKAF